LAGKFRFELKENVYLGGLGVFKMPIEWQVVQEQMEMFFDFLRWRSGEVAAKRMHPIEFAALVHFVYVCFFWDSNANFTNYLLDAEVNIALKSLQIFYL
jgi:hypothetical protein